MNDYNKNTEIIIDELRELQNNHIKLSTHHFCEECKQPLFQQDKFFIFPCYHGFHRVCLSILGFITHFLELSNCQFI